MLMDKEEGITSFSSLSTVKKACGTKHVGHAGTLDKFASGLMICLIGKATKLNSLFMGLDKEYVASIRFGEETDTLDPEGEVVRRAPLPAEESIRAVLPSFLGEQMQRPPVYSAIHVEGKRAYKAARKGESPEMPERKITVSSIDLLSFTPQEAVIRASVSKGTYIRSLCRDIAERAGSAGYTAKLRRLRIGPYRVDETALSTREILSRTGAFSRVVFPEGQRKHIDNGSALERNMLSDSSPSLPYAFIYIGDELYGIAERKNGGFCHIIRLDDGEL